MRSTAWPSRSLARSRSTRIDPPMIRAYVKHLADTRPCPGFRPWDVRARSARCSRPPMRMARSRRTRRPASG